MRRSKRGRTFPASWSTALFVLMGRCAGSATALFRSEGKPETSTLLRHRARHHPPQAGRRATRHASGAIGRGVSSRPAGELELGHSERYLELVLRIFTAGSDASRRNSFPPTRGFSNSFIPRTEPLSKPPLKAPRARDGPTIAKCASCARMARCGSCTHAVG